ncbi:serine/threonine-protein phosphatase 6 regulatory subunit 3 [Capsicum galapagoense]
MAMFWRMAGLSTASPVDTILDKENFALDELLDEDEIIQECKALNGRLINCLRERAQVEQLVRYIVEEAPEDAEKKRTFKFPFIACEIFTCEVDIILKALVENEELMNLLFSFLEPEHAHSTLLAGYFSKVVICLLLRKTSPFMNYVQAHPDIIKKLVDLIGITSIMEVLIRLIGTDEHLYSNFSDSMQWLEETDVLEMIVDKFSSSDCPEVHANAAETLCAITRYAPPGIAAKISSPSFIERLFRHALEDSRPKSVLVNSLSVCISLLDPKRLASGTYYMYGRQSMQCSGVNASPETVEGMLGSLGNLLKLLDISSEDNVLPTTYGSLHPPLGKHRLKIIEFVSVLVSVSSEAAENELIRLGAVKRILELFFEYPYNNFLHHHVETIIISCLESKNIQFVEHLLGDCNLVMKILEAEKNSTLAADPSKPTVSVDGRSPPRIGNIGHMTRIANKLVQLGNNNNSIQSRLQENSEWIDWQTNTLQKRNAVENVFQWTCGRPTSLHDRMRDSDDDDYQDRDYDVAALANNLSQAFRYGIYNNDELDEARGSLERDDEDVYFDDESAEVVISSLRLGDDQESGSLFTNSNWFAFEDDRAISEQYTGLAASPSPNTEDTNVIRTSTNDDAAAEKDDDLADTATSTRPEPKPSSDHPAPSSLSEDLHHATGNEATKLPEWVEWRESSDTIKTSNQTSNSPGVANVVGPPLPNGDVNEESVAPKDTIQSKEENAHIPPTNRRTSNVEKDSEGSSSDTSKPPETGGSPSASKPSSVSLEKPSAGTVGPSNGETEM